MVFAAQKSPQNPLRVKITLPYPYSIIRGDVPVYGVACGKGFKKYRLEYGEGENPQEWALIVESDKPQLEENSQPKVDFSLDKTIPGNLGMWDTGLTEYQYGEHKANLDVGFYTLRLTAIDKRGKSAEDKVIVEVGRVVLNSIGGRVESKDAEAVFIVSEHSLYDAVEVVSLKSLEQKSIPLPKNCKLVGKVYEINPPGLKFTQNVTLKIKYVKEKISNSGQLGIFVFDTINNKWEYLDSFLNEKENIVETFFKTMPEKFALYAVFEADSIKNTAKKEAVSELANQDGGILCKDTFENEFGQWKNKYGEVGALLDLSKDMSTNGTSCLKATNQKGKGNFACIVRSQPFDARKYPLVSFDYKIPANVKTNFFVKVSDKWWDIVFTDDEKIYWDINMEKAGKIPNIMTDNQWHYAEFNLFEMLKGRTNNFVVQEMIMANWDSTGFMKLEFGHNPKDAVYYIDNFVIKSNK